MSRKQAARSACDKLDAMNIPYQKHIDCTNEEISGAKTCEALGFSADRVYKSFLFLSHGRHRRRSILVLPANKMLDLEKAAAAVGAPGRIAGERETFDALRINKGFFGPLCTDFFPIIVDRSVLCQKTVLINSGVRGEYLELAPDDLIRAAGARCVDLSGGPSVERYGRNLTLPLNTELGGCRITGVRSIRPLEILYRGRELSTGRDVEICECFPHYFGFHAVRGADGVTVRMLKDANDMTCRCAPDPLESSHLMGVQERFFSCAQAASELALSVSPVVLDVRLENQTAYTITESLEGEFLRDRVSERGRMKWETVQSLLIPLLDRIESLGEAGNRIECIRPDTILLREQDAVIMTHFVPTDLIYARSGLRYYDTAGYEPYMLRNRNDSAVSAFCAVLYYALTGHSPGRGRKNSAERSEECRLLQSLGVPDTEARALVNQIW